MLGGREGEGATGDGLTSHPAEVSMALVLSQQKLHTSNDTAITLLTGQFSGSATDAWKWRGDHYTSVPCVLHVVPVHLVQ